MSLSAKHWTPIAYQSLALFLSLLVMTGCSPVHTAGVYNTDLPEKKPYVFSYDGSVQEATVSLRNALLPTGFSPANQDEYEGGASFVFTKTLSDDEKFEVDGYYKKSQGTSFGKQSGKLIFLLADEGNGTVTVRMTPRLTSTVKQEENAFKTSQDQSEAQLTQGHPLPMKYGRKLAEMPGWRLRSPSRAAVFKTEGEPRDEDPDARDEKEAVADVQSDEPAPSASSPPAASEETSDESTAPQPEERPGDGGDDIAWVQRTLNDLNYACGAEDGVMGSNTRTCIRAFQRANGLDATGEVDEATYERMLERL